MGRTGNRTNHNTTLIAIELMDEDSPIEAMRHSDKSYRKNGILDLSSRLLEYR